MRVSYYSLNCVNCTFKYPFHNLTERKMNTPSGNYINSSSQVGNLVQQIIIFLKYRWGYIQFQISNNLSLSENINSNGKAIIKGKLKIHQKDYEYNVNELTTIFVTRKQYYLSSRIQNEFDFTRSYIVSPKLLLASLGFVQKGKNLQHISHHHSCSIWRQEDMFLWKLIMSKQ